MTLRSLLLILRLIFQLNKSSPASVTLQPAPGDTGKPCGVDYELKTYVAENADDVRFVRKPRNCLFRLYTYVGFFGIFFRKSILGKPDNSLSKF